MSDKKKAVINAVMLRSKTVNVNVLAGAVVTILQQFGFELDAGTVAAILVLINIALRFVTDLPLEEK